MSFVTTQPELMAAAAGNLAGIGSTVAARDTAAAASITAVLPAAADQVSVLTAAQFAAYGHLYQTLSAQADTILELFTSALRGAAGSYAMTEDANVALAG
ncbi:PE family protein [Mycobacterium sp. M1]|uniref:PE family protein n=1 Tax=Mycolicibacter acidiphilus TaxID=2835306 RepID=A0ABS5RK34_9MYCO|nr:PE family protein [Mycolicibacter acidiphilus]MBS9534655.1 PE family protein [Mycolicibacter acidiphilus]